MNSGAYGDASTSGRGLMGVLAQLFRGAKRGEVVALNSGAGRLDVNLDLANNFSYLTTENVTLREPTNMQAGQHGSITITQGGTAHTMLFDNAWKFPGGTVPTLTTTPGAVDVLTYYVNAAGFVTAALLKDVKR